jgi:hypothetical protein
LAGTSDQFNLTSNHSENTSKSDSKKGNTKNEETQDTNKDVRYQMTHFNTMPTDALYSYH